MDEDERVEPRALQVVKEAEVPQLEPQPRQCSVCGKFAGNGAGNIKKGRLGKGPDGRPVIDWICQTCREAERQRPEAERDARPVYPAGYLRELVARLTVKAKANAEVFEAAKQTWKDVASGKAEPPVIEAARATHFAVLRKGSEYVVVAINSFHAAAIAQADQAGLSEQILVFKDQQAAEKEAARLAERARRFEERKAQWLTIAAGTKEFASPDKDPGTCEVPDCNRKVSGGLAVVNGEVVELCNFCGAALLAAKREGGCQQFAFFRGKDALEKVQRHLAWLRRRRQAAKRVATANGAVRDFSFYDRPGAGLRKRTKPGAAAQHAAKKREKSLRDQARHRQISALPRPGEKIGKGGSHGRR